MSSSWENVSKNKPCEGCAKDNWCSRSKNGDVTMCRRPHLSEIGILGKNNNQEEVKWIFHNGKKQNLQGRRKIELFTNNKTTKQSNYANSKMKVYSSLINKLTLQSNHLSDLHDKRGISKNEIIKRQYRSYNFDRNYRNIISLVNEFSIEDLLSTPGFYLKNEKLVFYSAEGLIIPVRDLNSKIIALKVRVTTLGGKYLYISSKKKGGAGPGAPIHIPIHENKDYSVIYLTEGEIKADIATIHFKRLCVSIPGVQAWKGFIDLIRNLNTKEVRIALDSDMQSNPNVAQALININHKLNQLGIKTRIITW